MAEKLGAIIPGAVGSTRAYRMMIRNDPCSYCGHRGGTLDHIEPRCRIVEHEGPRNLTGACQECNGRKGAMPLLRFLLAA